jgi:hypothetical protein
VCLIDVLCVCVCLCECVFVHVGAGEPNFDSYVANPYASLRERREQEVAQLLDKLQPDTIVLDPETIGRCVCVCICVCVSVSTCFDVFMHMPGPMTNRDKVTCLGFVDMWGAPSTCVCLSVLQTVTAQKRWFRIRGQDKKSVCLCVHTCRLCRVRKEPLEVQRQRKQEAEEANRAARKKQEEENEAKVSGPIHA